MHTHLITTNQFFKHATFPSVVGIYHTLFSFFLFFVPFVWNWHLSQKKPRCCSALLLPFHWRLPTRSRESEREREREEERVGQKKTKKRDRFGDGKG